MDSENGAEAEMPVDSIFLLFTDTMKVAAATLFFKGSAMTKGKMNKNSFFHILESARARALSRVRGRWLFLLFLQPARVFQDGGLR